MSNIESIVKGAWKSTKNTVLQVPEIEKKVKEATSNDPWGPTGTQMREIAQATHHYQDLPLVMATIWRRLNDHGKYWRHVYKSLLVIDYLLRNGSEQVIRECRDNVIQIQTLTEFQHIENDKDVGLSVRERAKLIVELIHDDKRLKAEREKARATSKKFLVGMSNEVSGGYGGGYGGGGYDNSDYDSDARRSEYNDERSYENEEPEQPSPSNRTSSYESPSSNSDSRRPRAPSFGNSSTSPAPASNSRSSAVSSPARNTTSAPAPVSAPAQAPPNLFDLDVPSSTPAKSQDIDFFNTPAVGGFGTTPSTFGTPAPSFGTNPVFPTTTASVTPGFAPSANLFDPRTTSTATSPTQPGNGWANFQSHETDSSAFSSDTQEKKNDPWNQTHLINLDFNKSSSSTTSQIKPSMGTLATAPMGGSAKPMGQPSNAMGPGKQVTAPAPTFPSTGQMGMSSYPTGMQPGYPATFGSTYTTAPAPMGAPMYTQPTGAPMYTQPTTGTQPAYPPTLGGYGMAPNTMYTAQKPATGTQPNWF
mmetsp:Transcript_5120/g.7217  ORF Transcript_5120/g.7217 Transcript_5120/m.7217 type:complete len:532 (-) Transcript_5120:2844-4439(-)